MPAALPHLAECPGAVQCPALLISAPASGQGKTTATAALARWHVQQGRRGRVFKTGPDFLDPMLLARASGAPVYQLDLWMGGEAHCRQLLWEAAQEADVILVEGVMGLHDGASSTADLAIRLGLPVMAVIDASAMAQTFGALAFGLANYRPGLTLAGVLANRVGSDGHATLLRESLPDRAAEALGRLQPAMPDPVVFAPAMLPPEQAWLGESGGRALQGVRIGVARDAAFAFLYLANLDVLRAMGAQLCFFSPLADAALPGVDALYLPGGYPELHLQALAANAPMREAVRAHHAACRPIVAECGGMLALLDGLTDHAGQRSPMWGLLPGEGSMEKRLVNLGLHGVTLPEGTLRGHTFHHARMHSQAVAFTQTEAQRLNGRPEAVWRDGRLHASLLHPYFPSNPAAGRALFAPTGAPKDAHVA